MMMMVMVIIKVVLCQGCASTPQEKPQLENLRQAAEDLRLATEAAAAGTLRKQLLTALQVMIIQITHSALLQTPDDAQCIIVDIRNVQHKVMV